MEEIIIFLAKLFYNWVGPSVRPQRTALIDDIGIDLNIFMMIPIPVRSDSKSLATLWSLSESPYVHFEEADILLF